MTAPPAPSRGESTQTDGDESAATIRANIERTRERLGETVEALGAQLNPSNLTQRVKESVREATIGKVQHMATNTRERISDAGRSLAQTIRDNPIPAAMAAAGIGWMLLSDRDRPRTRPLTTGEPDEFDVPHETGQPRGIRENVRNAAEAVADKAQHLTEQASDATERVVQKARETGNRVAEKADVAASRARNTARSATRRVETSFEENPMGMGAIALAVGLAIGLSVPATRKEAELMGDTRDKLLDKTRERVADTTERVERVVERALPEVQHVVRDAARDEGLAG